MIEILESYLTNRYQYVELQNIQSHIIQSPDCSVIQGSKLSGLLYTIYTNEIPRVHELMTHEEWLKNKIGTEIRKFTDVRHNIVNFVDNSNSMICFDEENYANHY